MKKYNNKNIRNKQAIGCTFSAKCTTTVQHVKRIVQLADITQALSLYKDRTPTSNRHSEWKIDWGVTVGSDKDGNEGARRQAGIKP